jgi:mRNA-degrading endonuclease RelE of RelBE toxin-antitoxin system
MTWALTATASARKQLRRIDPQHRARVQAALAALAADPFGGDVKRLKGYADHWHLRVGDYRIIFEVDWTGRHVVFGAVLRRTSTTY